MTNAVVIVAHGRMFSALGSLGAAYNSLKNWKCFYISVEPGPGLPGASQFPASLCTPEWDNIHQLLKAVPPRASFNAERRLKQTLLRNTDSSLAPKLLPNPSVKSRHRKPERGACSWRASLYHLLSSVPL